MRIWKLIIFSFLLSVFALSVRGQVANEDIVSAFSKGSSASLVRFFDNNITLKISSKEGYYSKNQAEEILQIFFKNVQPYQFNIIQKGISGNATFFIGVLRTQKKSFKVLYYTNAEHHNLIQEVQVIE